MRPGAPHLWPDRPGCRASDGAAGSASGAGATLRPSAPAQDAPSELTNARLAASGLGVFIMFTKLQLRSSQAKKPSQTPIPAFYMNASRAGFPSGREMGLGFQASH